MAQQNHGAVRSRLASRESFFGGPVSTREQSKAPHWSQLLKAEAAAAAHPPPAASAKGSGAARGRRQPTAPPPPPRRPPSPDHEALRRERLRQRRDFGGLSDDDAGAGAGAGQLQVCRAFYGGQQPPAALEERMRYNKRRLSLESEGSLLDDFLDDSGEEGEEGEDWRGALREALGGYDPSKFAALDRLGDRGMEANFSEIDKEERRALRLARAADQREAELEAVREAAKRERKRARRRRGVGAFLDDGGSEEDE